MAIRINVSGFSRALLAAAISAAVVPAQAAEFYFGADEDISLRISSQLDVGASWRLNEADPRFIGYLNGGEGFTSTTDDGNLNFEEGETFSKIIKGVHDIELSKDNFGVFMRVKYWYDKELEGENRPHGTNSNNYAAGEPLSDEGFSEFAKFSGLALLDAYTYLDTEVAEMPVSLRLGRQVLSWGESTFIQGGINAINPVDVSAFRRPGAELKEGLLPVGMAYFNAGVTENLSVEGFYQYEWEKTQIEGCGTYFSSTDYAADGCDRVTIMAPDAMAVAGGLYAQRQDDIEPEDGGQYGFAARYYAAALNDTEFGVYFMNIHSRMPYVSAIRTAIPAAVGEGAPVFVPSSHPEFGALSVYNPAYMVSFPEDLKVYGLSFATNVAGVALSGELSYKPDTPLQVNGSDILNAALSENPMFAFTSRVNEVGYGEVVRGYDTFDQTQLQVTAIKFFDRVLGASRLALIGEVGVSMLDGVEDSDQRYGRNTVFGLGDFTLPNGTTCSNLVALGAIDGDCSAEGYVTDTAWGYRARAALEYPNVFAGISLNPTLAWSHDVNGYSAEPGQQFHEGAKSLGLAVEAVYKMKYSATLGVTAFDGGSHNILEDKDFVSLSFKVSY
ncbi:DUF1302 domain-containing protein [Microbulbifer bruguierae]|uniref:DUF1302 domain-containing protein n=1 Tax=Microbulbifer bruguierae TaxID=3029061 RepID=A0ABY8NIP1_9GAMM|nr:DUF1302 domain-containing protein [Microbulbifer bruguierae]WGL18320.1 DUF1302 domain-containing protein [Microbulbifer bruguierae]